MHKKKVLLISYHFPPDTAVGGIRPAKFAKYLPEFGWEPYVLTIKERCIKSKDQSRLEGFEETKIFRVTVWPNLMEILLKFRNLILLRSVTNNFKSSSNVASNPEIFKKREKGLIRCLDRYLSSIFEFPDKMIGWLIPAVWKGYWLVKKEKIELVLTTSPPRTVSLVGLILSKLTKIKLITDFRDPCFLHCDMKHKSIWTNHLEVIARWLGREIIKNSEKIISTTEQYAEFLSSCHPEIPIDKFNTIFNGFDSNDCKFSDTLNDESDLFVLTYLGAFYYGRTPSEFLEALSQLCQENIIPVDKLKVNFIGNVRYVEGIPIEQVINETNLNGCINISDKIQYRESLAQMEKSVVLLLFAPEQYYAIPAKAYEYLFAGRYILCFAKDGATADLIRETKSGIVVDPYDIKEIKDAIKILYLQWEKGIKPKQNFDINVFERRELTHKLSQILDEII